jgi:hypothetical protein
LTFLIQNFVILKKKTTLYSDLEIFGQNLFPESTWEVVKGIAEKGSAGMGRLLLVSPNEASCNNVLRSEASSDPISPFTGRQRSKRRSKCGLTTVDRLGWL